MAEVAARRTVRLNLRIEEELLRRFRLLLLLKYRSSRHIAPEVEELIKRRLVGLASELDAQALADMAAVSKIKATKTTKSWIFELPEEGIK
jgi:hypothetical protein